MRIKVLLESILIICLLVIFLPSPVANAQVVTFPDPNLEAAIRGAIDKPTGDIYQSDLVGLTMLEADSHGIIDLTGIEHCTNLIQLYLSINQISNLSPLAGLTNLASLSLDNNGTLSDISPLAGLINLTQLWLYGNPIYNIAPLEGLTNLTTLNLDNTYLYNNISSLEGLTNLESLSLGSAYIYDISSLEGLTNLESLNLAGNDIIDISPLSELTNLADLNLRSTCISNIEPLVNNPGLSSGDYVNLRFNNLDDISINIYAPQLQARGVIVDYDQPPNQPTNVSPVDGATGISLTPTLVSSAFSDPNGGYQNYAVWLITTISGDYDHALYGIGDSEHLTSLTIDIILDWNTTYYWRVIHQDDQNMFSEWSVETSFTTMELVQGPTPAQPSNVSPASGATFVDQTQITLQSSAFSDPDPGRTHVASQWQVTEISGDYSSPIYDSETDFFNLTSITIDTNDLDCNTDYYWHVRHQNDQGASSYYSTETSFTYDGNTPTGTNVSVEVMPGYATVAFAQVTTAGCTTPNPFPGEPIENWGPVPEGFRAVMTDAAGFSTTAIYSGPVTMDLFYPESWFNDENFVTQFYWNGANWVNANAVVDTVNDRTHFQMPTLAPIFLAEQTECYTPAGSNVPVEVMPGYATVTFAQVTTAGCTTPNPFPGEPIENWGPVPEGFRAVMTDAAGFSTTAIYSGPVTMDLFYPESWFNDENFVTQFYWNGANWVNANAVVDTVNDRTHFQMPTLAPIFLAEREETIPLTVTTNNAVNVFATSATLVGYLDSRGTASSVDVSFQWATEDYYTTNGNYNNETSPPWPMTSTGFFGYSLTGLSPDTNYHFRAKAVGDSIAYGNDMTFITAGTGSDGDAIPADVEDAAPNNGDGNSDGTPDSQQAEVSSLPNAANGEYTTIESPGGTSLTGVSAVNVNSLPSEGKPNLAFPYGLFAFNISGIPAGSTVWVTLYFENPVPADSQYWKYGPTPDNPSPHWYQIPINSNDGDNVIQIPLVDGGLGDDDLMANAEIIDQGGPGNPPQPGGGGASGVPVFPNAFIGIAAALGAGVLAYLLRRRLVREV